MCAEIVERSGYFYRVDPPEIPDPHLRALHDYWEQKRGPRFAPTRAEIDPMQLRPHLGYLFMIDVLPGLEDFRYRLIGTHIVAIYGRDSTGRTIREVYAERDPVSHAWLKQLYLEVVNHKVPVLTWGPLKQANKDYVRFDAIYLPVSDDGENVNLLFCESRFSRTDADAPEAK